MYVVRAIKVTTGALRETSILARYGLQPMRLSHQCGAADRARQRTSSALACQQGCTEASHDLSIMTPFSCAAPTPASAAAERDALGLAPVPSTSMLALGDNMVSNVEAAAQSTTEGAVLLVGADGWQQPQLLVELRLAPA